MRTVWQIAAKELLQTRRDRLAALFTLVLPVVFTVFLGLLIPDTEEADSRLPLALVDQDQTAASERLVEQLRATTLLEVKPTSSDKIERAVQDQQVAAGLVIPKGYATALETATPVSLTFIRLDTLAAAYTVERAIQEVLSSSDILARASDAAVEQVFAHVGRTPGPEILATARSLVQTELASPRTSLKITDAKGASALLPGGFDQSSTGSLVTWVLFSLLTIATGVTWERRHGLLRRLAVAGVRARHLIGGKLTAMVAMTLLQQALLILLGQLAFGVDYLASPLALAMTMVSLSVLASSFGLLISSLFRSEAAVVAVMIIVAQLLGALSGGWFPLEITGPSFQQVAHVLPTAWIVHSLHQIVLGGMEVSEVLRPLGVVWAWIVPLLLLAVWRFRAISRY